MIDFHCHILPDLDDGPETADEALVMAQGLYDFGFHEICCTPHCSFGHYDISPTLVRERVQNLQEQVDKAGINIRLLTGMEYYLDEYFTKVADDLLPLGQSRLVLCEAPLQADPDLTAQMLKIIVNKGFVPMLAHPERIPSIMALLRQHEAMKSGEERGTTSPLFERLRSWLTRSSEGNDTEPGQAPPLALPAIVCFQANIGSFTGFYGNEDRKQACWFFEKAG